jgi:hypothetical protein
MVMYRLNVSRTSAKKDTGFIHFFPNTEPFQHFSTVLRGVLLHATFDIFVFTVLVVAFFP